MIRFLRSLWQDRRGNALVITAAALPLLVGSAGLATDTIQWAVWKRQLQRAADSAALAGVRGLVAGQTPVGTCATTSPVGRDLQLNNHVLLGNSATNCTAENSPTSGPWASDRNAVRVNLSAQRRLGFSSLFMAATPTIRASATATVVATGQYCVISLENTNATGMTYQGNASVNLGCGMKTNSKGTCATDAGGSARVHSSPVAAVGGICNSNGVFDSDTVLQPYSAPQTDPFAGINPPGPTSYPAQACPNFRVNANASQSGLTANTDYRAMVGLSNYYCMGSMTLNGNVTLPSGVYVIDGGGISVGSQAVVRCTNCTFILTNRSSSSTATIGTVNMNGGATINLVSSNSGPYQGLLFYQDRRAQLTNGNGQSNIINGNSSSSFAGSFYFPSQQVMFNGTSGMTTNCVQLVSRQVTFSGNTSISNVCDSTSGARAFDATTIRLVA